MFNLRDWFHLLCLGLTLCVGWASSSCLADELEPWEYSPYKVGIWLAVDPAIDKSEQARAELLADIEANLARTFAATCRIEFPPVPPNLLSTLERGVSGVSVDDFTDHDLVLLLDKENAELKSLRVFDTALEQLSKIGMTTGDHQQLVVDTTPLAQSEQVAMLLSKTNELFEDYEQLLAALKQHSVPAVLVPRGMVTMFANHSRTVATILPWHTERFLRDFDKLFLMRCRAEGDAFAIEVRELDCPMRQFGPLVSKETANWSNVANLICSSAVTAFAPVARIEEANGRLVSMINRAGGLALAGNPALILPGEVLQPMIRRLDRRGGTTLLEPIPWTYIGVTAAADGIHLEGTALSAMGNNALQGKQTRGSQRFALRVRPMSDRSDVKLVVRTRPNETQPGCQIYQRDLLTDDMRFLGHTDWRGIITVQRDDVLGSLVPERIKVMQTEARKLAAAAADKAALEAEAAKREAEKKAEQAAKEADGKVDEDSRGPAAEPSAEAKVIEGQSVPTSGLADKPAPLAPQAPEDKAALEAAVPLRQPLVLLYVKSGDTVLARLPLVPGLNEVDIADLPSDAVRLEAEAYFRGFQGEVLDLIGRRAICASRMTLLLKNRKFKEAEELLREVTLMPDYKSMSDRMNAIHQRMLEEARDPTSAAAKTRIDAMLKNTREVLQKHVEKDLTQVLRSELEAAQKRAIQEDRAAAEQAAAEQAAAEQAAAAQKAAAEQKK